MKFLTQFCLLILFTVATSNLGSCSETPDFQYSSGKNGYFSEYKGKWLLINYWAEWCRPCIEEIPELNSFAQNHPDVNVVGVNYDAMPNDKELAVIKRLNIAFPVARVQMHEHFGFAKPNALPTSIIITPEGTIHKILAGPQTSETLEKNIYGDKKD